MSKPTQWLHIISCMVGLAACGEVLTETEEISCAGLPATCGAGSNDDCCKSLEVDGGMFYRGYDKAGDSSSGNMNYPATVSSFRLDKYLVTVERFRAFVTAGMGTQLHAPMPGAGAHAKIPTSGWDAKWNEQLSASPATLAAAVQCDPMYQTWTDAPGPNDHRPITCVTWYEAMAFCLWDGGYLPTEAEWSYAAAGGDQQRAYPWSNPAGALTVDGNHASYLDGMNCVGDGMPGCTVADLVPVGSKPAGDGRWGQSDLGGNVFERTLDFEGPYPNLCMDCAVLTSTSDDNRTRGGSFSYDPSWMRTVARSMWPRSGRHRALGFRCARNAP